MNLSPNVAILGASGLIGSAVATDLMRHGFRVVAVARRFTAAQRGAFADFAHECPIAALDVNKLAHVISEWQADIVINCLGILQNRWHERADEVHRGFVLRLLESLRRQERTILLIHLSIPGSAEGDRTIFSRTKRDAEHLIATSSIPFVILRPGFVVAPSAYGGSALIRALAALPFDLPRREAGRPFASIDIGDVAKTISETATRWRAGEKRWNAIWDLMERHPSTIGGVVDSFRRRFGGPRTIARLPSWLLETVAHAGDVCALLGWSSPVCTTALREMRRGLEGHPESWIAATGIEPLPLEETLTGLPSSAQETWFARLYLVKPILLASLAGFWCASGLIALTVAFPGATAILTSHGAPFRLSQGLAIAAGLSDVLVGAAITVRRTCRAGLTAGIVLSMIYLLGATLIAPELWIQPLGALIKVVPAIALMLVGLAILKDR
ncbi:MAG TPA: SDR family oxidoreductase [Rhizomicrobium sp.]|jgi:uncharacterized protein YbjT (DUF2867 family)